MSTHILRSQLPQPERASLRDLFQEFWAKVSAERLVDQADEPLNLMEIEKRARELRAEWIASQRVFSGE